MSVDSGPLKLVTNNLFSMIINRGRREPFKGWSSVWAAFHQGGLDSNPTCGIGEKRLFILSPLSSHTYPITVSLSERFPTCLMASCPTPTSDYEEKGGETKYPGYSVCLKLHLLEISVCSVP